MAICDGASPQSWLPYNSHDYVWTPGAAQTLGAAPVALETIAGSYRWFHRICAAPIRAHGSTRLLERASTQGTNIPRSSPDACRRPARALSPDHQHPGIVGKNGER